MKTYAYGLNRKLLKGLVLLAAAAAVFLLWSAGAHAMTLTAVPAAPDTDTQILLDWTSVPGADTYKIYRKPAGPGVFADPPIVTVTIDDLNYLSYTDTGLTPETAYDYEIRAYMTGNAVPLDTQTRNNVSTTAMIAPAINLVQYNINDRTFTVTWTHNTKAGATGGVVKRIDTDEIMVPITSTATSCTFSNEPVTFNATVGFYAESTKAGLSNSPPSAFREVVPVVAPALDIYMSGSRTLLLWDVSFIHIDQFNLERSRYNGTAWDAWQLVNDHLSTDDLGGVYDYPVTGGIYRYRLIAKSDGSYKGFVLSGTGNKPAAPTGLSGTVIAADQIRLAWTIDASNPCTLLVERRTGTGLYDSWTVLDKSATSYTDTDDFVPGTTYTYRVSAYDHEYNWVPSGTISITASAPSAPTQLSAIAQSSTRIDLTWTDGANNETSCIIERRKDTGSYEQIATVGANVTAFSDNNTPGFPLEAGHAYSYRVRAVNAFGNSVYSNEVSVSSTTAAVAPNTLTVTPVLPSQIDLSWSYPGTGSYSTIIERKTGSGGAWAVIYTAPAGTYKFSNTGLAADTQYFYRVSNSLGTGVTTRTLPDNNTGIGAYTMLGGLSLTGTPVSGGKIQLTWSGAPVNSEVIIERKMASGNFASLGTVAASPASWTDTTGLIPGAAYTYRIKAKSTTNESVYSNELSIHNVFLEAPTNLTVEGDSSGRIKLAWADNSTEETGFEIWRYIYGTGVYYGYGTGTYVLIATLDKNSISYTDHDVVPGVQYSYMVRACIKPGDVFSASTYTSGVGLGIITPPGSLVYSLVSSTQIKLTWTDKSNNETGFKVESRNAQDGTWTVIAWLSANTTSYTVSGLNVHTRYAYRIRAYNNSGTLDSYSNEIEVSLAIPKAPVITSLEAVSSTQVNIKWTDNSDNETGFRIYRKLWGAGWFSLVAEVGPGVTSYADRGLYADSTYIYKVAVYSAGGSMESAEKEVKTRLKVTFKDLGGIYAWAKEAIENLAGRGVLLGTGKGNFSPGARMSRGDFVRMVIRGLKLDGTAPIGSLADVKVNHAAYKEIMIAENLGIISKDSKNKFYPDRAITREEIAVILCKALEVAGKPLEGYDNSVLEKYWDRELISPYALSSMAAVVGGEVINERSGTTIAPRDYATRAEAAVMFYRVIDRQPD